MHSTEPSTTDITAPAGNAQPQILEPSSEPVLGPLGPPSGPGLGAAEHPLREPARAFLAFSLFGLFVIEVVAGRWFALFGYPLASPPFADRLQILKDVSAIFVGPTIALVGSATAFYFARSSG